MQQDTQEAIYTSFEVLKQADQYYNWLASQVRPYIRGKTLEIGSGIGNFARWAQEAASEYHTSEADPQLVAVLQQKFKHAFLWNVYETFPTNDSYDTIVTVNVIEHLEDDLKALRSLHQRLKAGGHLIVIAPAMPLAYGSLDRSFGHFRRYTKRGMIQLLEKLPFTVLKKRYVNVVGLFGWVLYSKILKHNSLPDRLCSHFNLTIPLLKLERPIAHFVGLSLLVIARKDT